MKKMLSLLLVLMLSAAALAACGSGSTDSDADIDADNAATVESVEDIKTIGDIISLECEDEQMAVYEDTVVYAFSLGGAYYRAKAAISPDDFQAYMDIDYADSDFEDQQRAIVAPLAVDEIEDLGAQMLSDEELAALTGKTGRELQNEGWTYSGYDLDQSVFWMNCGPFQYSVYFDIDASAVDFDSFEAETGTADLEVTSAEFSALGDGATDIETVQAE